ncbi:MAG: hypothetical protein WCK46_03310 [Candidatus Adlerbacteria bacterium]
MLNPELIQRIERFKAILGDAEPKSLEETLQHFEQDENPEGEVRVWEKIAGAFQRWLADHPTQDISMRKETFLVLMAISMGYPSEVITTLNGITHISIEEVKQLTELYAG